MRDRQRCRWEDDISEWTEYTLAESPIKTKKRRNRRFINANLSHRRRRTMMMAGLFNFLTKTWILCPKHWPVSHHFVSGRLANKKAHTFWIDEHPKTRDWPFNKNDLKFVLIFLSLLIDGECPAIDDSWAVQAGEIGFLMQLLLFLAKR